MIIPVFLFGRQDEGALTSLDWVNLIQPNSEAVMLHQENPVLHPLVARLLSLDDQALALHFDKTADFPGVHLSNGEMRYEMIVYAENPDQLRNLPGQWFASGDSFITLKATVRELRDIARHEGVTWIEPPSLLYPLNDRSRAESGATAIQSGMLFEQGYRGDGVIVSVFDTGIDWRHPDFRLKDDTTRTRIKYIWDQTISPQGGETSPEPPYDFGTLYTRDDIEAALSGGAELRTFDTNGHGTHVAGTAAGNGDLNRGVAPAADLIIIKGGNQSFTQVNLLNGINFMAHKREQSGQPLVGNFSIGGQLSPRDGTDPSERAMDQASKIPGTVMVTSAGNSGSQFRHFSGTTGTDDIVFTIPDYTPNTGSNNDRMVIDVWFSTDDPVDMTLSTPGGNTYTWNSNTSFTAPDSSEGVITVNNFIHAPNGHRRILLDLNDAVEEFTPAQGIWRMSFEAQESLFYHSWTILNRLGTRTVIVNGADNDYSITTPGTAMKTITVGAYVVRTRWINIQETAITLISDPIGHLAGFSSRGPTRDERIKPNITAPGRYIASSRSQTSNYSDIITLPGNRHSFNSGTSMSAPHVTGSAALMLQAQPEQTSDNLLMIMENQGTEDNATASVPNMNWGFGKLNLINAIAELTGEKPLWLPRSISNSGNFISPNLGFFELGAGNELLVVTEPLQAGLITELMIHTANITSSGELLITFHEWDGSNTGPELGPATLIQIDSLASMQYQTIDLSEKELINAETGPVAIRITNESSGGSLGLIEYEPAPNPVIFAPARPNDRQPLVELGFTQFTGDNLLSHIRDVPEEIQLFNNYPNPFNLRTVIRYGLPQAANVSLEVYDILGRRVAVLARGFEEAGFYEVTWNAGQQASGVYLYRLRVGNQIKTGKMMLVK